MGRLLIQKSDKLYIHSATNNTKLGEITLDLSSEGCTVKSLKAIIVKQISN